MTVEPSVQITNRAGSARNRTLIAQLMAKINDGREQEALADCEALAQIRSCCYSAFIHPSRRLK